VRFASVQPRYNLLFRQPERELLPLCLEDGVGVIPYNPLAGGMLTGKHDRDRAPPADGRFAFDPQASPMYRDRYWHDQAFDAVDALQALAAGLDLAMPTLAVAWVLANPAVTSAIVGASRPDQLDASLAAAETTLDDAALAEIDRLTRAFRLGDAAR
jgi:aryl-alcohol dehydrogenase (NADP+)